jgi:hypothetical protein
VSSNQTEVWAVYQLVATSQSQEISFLSIDLGVELSFNQVFSFAKSTSIDQSFRVICVHDKSRLESM